MKSERGFSLVELLIYTSVLAVVGGLLTSILFNSVRITSRDNASAEVYQQLNLVMGTIQKLVGESSLIESVYKTDSDIDPANDPTVIDSSNDCDGNEIYCTLKLRFETSSVDPTWVIASSTGVYLVRGTETTTLTTDRVVVDYLRLTKYELAGGHSSVKAELSLTYNTQDVKSRVTRVIASAIGRVSAATFDSSLLPNAGSTFDVGQSDTKWRDGYFSRNVVIGGGLTVDTNTLYVDSASDKIGVGTTTPLQKLHVNGSVQIGSTLTDALAVGTTIPTVNTLNHIFTGMGVFMGQNVGGGEVEIGSNHYYNTGFKYRFTGFASNIRFNVGDIELQTAPSGTADAALTWTTRLIVKQSGNVGIGTTTPLAKLNIVGTNSSGNTGFLRLWNNGSGGSTSAGTSVEFNTMDNAGTEFAQAKIGTVLVGGTVGNPTSDLLFYTRQTAGVITERMRINAAGNVGIGTTTPAYRLDVYGPADTTEIIRANSASGHSGIVVSSGGTAKGYIWHNSTSSYFAVGPGSGSNSIIFYNNNIGIGVSAPAYKLEVTTDSAAKPSTNTWTISSDERVKTDIRPFTDGLGVVLNIDPILYKYNGKGGFAADGKDYIGVVAQDLQKVAPYTINTYMAKLNPEDSKDTELLNFNSHALTFNLINAVKELQGEINVLESKIEQLSGEDIDLETIKGNAESSAESEQQSSRVVLGTGFLGGIVAGGLILLLLKQKR